MELSTKITAKLVPILLEDVTKVVVDYTMARKGSKKFVDTGKFKLIYKGDKTINSFSQYENK